jgi:hypothetical protein
MTTKIVRCTHALVALLLAGIAGSALAQVSGKGDTTQTPGLNGWTLVNACSEPVQVAILADGAVSGWVGLAPGESTAFANRDTVVGVHALIGYQGTWWAPGGHRYVEVPIKMDGGFNYRLRAAPAGMTPRTFILYDILAWGGRVPICER